MSLQPLGDRIIVRVARVSETPGGIQLPATAHSQTVTAEVLAVGPGRHQGKDLIVPGVKAGDIVILTPFCGFAFDGEDIKIVAESDILAIQKP